MTVVVIAALATWLMPAGKYDTLSYKENGSFLLNKAGKEIQLPFAQKTLDSLHIRISLEKFSNGDIKKPLSVPGTYHRLPKNAQGIVKIIEAPLQGMYDTIDIILFIMLIGAFINIFYSTGAMEEGLGYLSHKMNGKESWLIITLTFLFSAGGSSFGMAEEALAFYPVLVPLFLAAGYDLLVPVAVIFGGTQIGTLSSFSNPFSTIIASNAAGISWADGFYGRILIFVATSAIFIWYIVRYAQKVQKDPALSLVLRYDGPVKSPYASLGSTSSAKRPTRRSTLLLLLFLCTFLVMVDGVIFLEWWLMEMSAVFMVASILVAVITRMGEAAFFEKFIKGAEGMLGVGFIIAVARGVTVILNEGNISDSILFYSAQLISHMPASLFIVVLLLLYMVFTLFISSSSGMAVVTMPIMGSLAVIAGVPGREIVNSYLFGMGIMGFITPTGLILPSLALVNVSIKTWWKFIWPLMLVLLLACAVFLIIGIKLG
jgi:uncharacterized ion transporter superfamily protein YfcC